jgi:hypothetical protein
MLHLMSWVIPNKFYQVDDGKGGGDPDPELDPDIKPDPEPDPNYQNLNPIHWMS